MFVLFDLKIIGGCLKQNNTPATISLLSISAPARSSTVLGKSESSLQQSPVTVTLSRAGQGNCLGHT